MQYDIAWEDPHSNFSKVRSMLAGAKVERGDFVLLPEMFDTGFSFNVKRTHDAKGETLAFLRAVAEQWGVVVQGGRTLSPAPGGPGRNVMTAVGPDGRTLGEYVKVHPFQREAERFEAGDAIVTYAWEAAGLKVCPAICYDARFPELFRAGLINGAEAYAIGACWPTVRIHHWRALLIARAIENQAYVFGVNRVGKDPMTSYSGGTIAVGPKGDVLGELGDVEGVLSVPVASQEVKGWREAFFAWQDARLLRHFKVS